MRRATAISLLALLLVSSRALTQQQPTGVIEGTVVRNDTGEPIPGVAVTLALPSPRSVTAITGADGKFSFKNLNAGNYRLMATRSGFVRIAYGQRNLNGLAEGGPIALSAGQAFNDAVLRMTPTGTVSGRILDENGRPATGAPLQLLRVVYTTDRRVYQPSARGVADNLGRYRIDGVSPGLYYLLAGTPPLPSQLPRFKLVYFPSASSVERASTIEVRPDADTSVDMQVPRSDSSYRVRGRIVNGTGSGWPTNPSIILSDGTRDGTLDYTGGGPILDPATGMFELRNVPAGDYTLQVTGNPTGSGIDPLVAVLEPAGVASIRVVDKDLEGVVVTLTGGVTVNGRIRVEGQPVSVIPNLQQMMLGVRPFNWSPPYWRVPRATPAASDGTFRIAGLREGEYRIFLIGPLPPGSGLYLKSIRFNGDDVLSRPLKFSGRAAGEFEVILGTGGLGRIAGNVTTAQSQAVPSTLVVAVPMERGRITDYRQTFADQNGRYTLDGITPGDYQLFSWESIEDGAFYDPDFLKQYEQHGKAIHVGESSRQNVDVRAIPAP